MKNLKDTSEDGRNTSGEIEDRLLAQCHQFIWNTYPETRYLTWHVPNERKQTRLQGAIMKAKGVVSGVSDYVINWNTKVYYIEFKTDSGKQSENQEKHQKQLEKHGFEYYIIRDFETFKKLIERILQ